ncbi:MAG: tetratricopeptide repeat protein [Ilumatobacteraceae bacterium]|jgi:tetratricopeptide (TPR) repeat protein|nr:tetratricopeptide repeat protein [Ilumatobacteraceae bacterium]MDP5068265.1 tetratricopeptide repeat protein [Ilumatobacteraceae bacterium]
MSDDLRHEQQFLLRSLRDLDNERAAGDIDDADYAALRDGYIARTAAITRELNGIESVTPAVQRGWVRRVLVIVCVIAVAAGAGIWVARQSGQRLPGQSASGAIEQSSSGLLATARQLNFSDPGKAIELYTQVLKLEPDNPEALTYRSWILALTARAATGSVKQLALVTAVNDLLRAQKLDNQYPDAHCFLGIVYFRFLNSASLAKPQLDTCRAMNPPKEVQSFVDSIVAEVDKALAK